MILDSDWEAEFCRVAESHPRVRAYVKNHNLGFGSPLPLGSKTRIYRPDFIVLVDDGHGEEDLLNLLSRLRVIGVRTRKKRSPRWKRIGFLV